MAAIVGMRMRDLEHLRVAGSPLMRFLSGAEDDGFARDWFARKFGEYAKLSPIQRTLEDVDHLLELVGADREGIAAGYIGLLPTAVQDDILLVSSFVQLERDDILIRVGDVDDTIYVCLSGRYEAVGDWAEPLTLGPGDCFGVELPREAPCRVRVAALSSGCVAVVPGRRMRRLAERFGAVVINWLTSPGLNGGVGLCHVPPNTP